MSEYNAEVVEIKPLKHPNAHSLSIVQVFSGYTVVINTAQWEGITKGVYIEPDTIVNTDRPEFNFLKDLSRPERTEHLVRAKKLRGIVSYGLLVPITDDTVSIGTNLWNELGLKHYNPETKQDKELKKAKGTGAPVTDELDYSPKLNFTVPKYDIENFRKYAKKMFTEGDELILTEKIHGMNVRFCYCPERNEMFCGSRYQWKSKYPRFWNDYSIEYFTSRGATLENAQKTVEKLDRMKANPKLNDIWKLLEKYPQIEAYCKAHPGTILYGEMYGQVQNGYRYGVPEGENAFAAFDIMVSRIVALGFTSHVYASNFIHYDDFKNLCREFNIPVVPEIARLKYNPNDISEFEKHCTGKTIIGNGANIREGVVVRDPIEVDIMNFNNGRKVLKLINPVYLEKDNGSLEVSSINEYNE